MVVDGTSWYSLHQNYLLLFLQLSDPTSCNTILLYASGCIETDHNQNTEQPQDPPEYKDHNGRLLLL